MLLEINNSPVPSNIMETVLKMEIGYKTLKISFKLLSLLQWLEEH